jgi:hypothetical protein
MQRTTPAAVYTHILTQPTAVDAAAAQHQLRSDCIAGLRCLLGMVQGYTGNSKASSNGTGAPSPASNIVPAAVPQPSAGVVLLRQMDQYRLWPTAEQLHLVDKKFGGVCVCTHACMRAGDPQLV